MTNRKPSTRVIPWLQGFPGPARFTRWLGFSFMRPDMTYKIVRRFFMGHKPQIIATGLTLAQAQAHCRDRETSSSTCTEKAGFALAAARGPWFDGYEAE